MQRDEKNADGYPENGEDTREREVPTDYSQQW